MKPVANPCLAVLIDGARFASHTRFAEAVNAAAWRRHGVRLRYDHISVKRWIAGSACHYPEAVADVLAEAWGVPIPETVIWPDRRDGGRPVPAHQQAWVADRTLDDLGIFVRSDMLTRRATFTAAFQAATGAAFIEPVTRWLGRPPGGAKLDARPPGAVGDRIGADTVTAIEQLTRQFAEVDAEVGGGQIREAAVGQLKHAVDLARDGRYSSAVGTQLLTAIADLSAWIGWMSFDAGMPGPAQRYSTYGLQAAHEAGTDAARIRASRSLTDLALYARARGQHQDARRLIDLALDRVPADRQRYNAVRANLWAIRARVLSPFGPPYLPEIRSALGLAIDLDGQSQHDEYDPAVARYWPYAGPAEVAGGASRGFVQLAEADPRFAAEAERLVLSAMAQRPPGFGRSRAFDWITVTWTRFVGGEPDQAAADGLTALDAAAAVPWSGRIRHRLGELVPVSARYRDRPAVAEFRERLAATLRQA